MWTTPVPIRFTERGRAKAREMDLPEDQTYMLRARSYRPSSVVHNLCAPGVDVTIVDPSCLPEFHIVNRSEREVAEEARTTEAASAVRRVRRRCDPDPRT